MNYFEDMIKPTVQFFHPIILSIYRMKQTQLTVCPVKTVHNWSAVDVQSFLLFSKQYIQLLLIIYIMYVDDY